MTTTEQSLQTAPYLTDTLKRYSSIAAFIGLVFLALLVSGIFLEGGGLAGSGMSHFLRAYLVGFWLWFGTGGGCLVILMTQYLTGGAWGVVIRRPLEAGAKTLYVTCFLFLPLLIFREQIYWWTTPAGLADKVIAAKSLYLNIPFLWVRWAIYSIFLCFFTMKLTAWSKQEDETKSTVISAKLEALSAPGILIFFILMTFCSVDYLMTLEPYWYSTVYGFMIIIGWVLTALAVVIGTLTILEKYEPMHHALTRRHYHDLGKLLFAMVMMWTYLNFSQLIITWSGNLPSEIVWYIKRWNGGWQSVALILLFGHFVLPFAMLLSQSAKRNSKFIGFVAGYIVAVHAIDVYSLVEPNFTKVTDPHFYFSWLDVVAPIGFGGLWFALYFRNLPRMPLLPLGAPDLIKALNHGRDH
jgi:hypothetical protein